MKKILIVIPHFYPGFKSGGPQQTINNFIDAFSDQINIYVYTQNHDFRDERPYTDIDTRKWIEYKNAKIMYEESNLFCGKMLNSLYSSFETIYLCGLFEKSTISLLMLHRKNPHNNKKVYVAPMGVFSEGAIKQKAFKKKLFILGAKAIGLFKDIIWSFTSEFELSDAKKILRCNDLNYLIAEDLPRKVDFENQKNKIANHIKNDKLKIVFLSRICKQKNLSMCFDILYNEFSKDISFDIYGIIEDKKYWNECCEKEKTLQDNVEIRYLREVHPSEVMNVFSKYDIFLFPTKGENFGHVIYEALASGCIPIISDKTPWQDLEENDCGYVCSLKNISEFVKAVNLISKMNSDTLLLKKIKCIEYAKQKYEQSVLDSGYKKIVNNDE